MQLTTPKAQLAPPFDLDVALRKVRLAEDAWNSRDPERIALACSPDSRWRNRDTFLQGRDEIRAFLRGKWERERDHRLIKSLWAHGDERIAVRFQYEWLDADGQWFRSYGNENWEFDAEGLMSWRQASINDVPILEADRKFRWDAPGPRPERHPGLAELGL
ncbi:MAG: nuclear transport factor 2 family protein [Planctomycetota bacterium]